MPTDPATSPVYTLRKVICRPFGGGYAVQTVVGCRICHGYPFAGHDHYWLSTTGEHATFDEAEREMTRRNRLDGGVKAARTIERRLRARRLAARDARRAS